MLNLLPLWSSPHLYCLFLESHPILRFSSRNLSSWGLETVRPGKDLGGHLSNPLNLPRCKQSSGKLLLVQFSRKAGLGPLSSVLLAVPSYLYIPLWPSVVSPKLPPFKKIIDALEQVCSTVFYLLMFLKSFKRKTVSSHQSMAFYFVLFILLFL